jgi:hypothetical protein
MATTAVIGFTTGTTAVVRFTTEHYKPLQQKSGFADDDGERDGESLIRH